MSAAIPARASDRPRRATCGCSTPNGTTPRLTSAAGTGRSVRGRYRSPSAVPVAVEYRTRSTIGYRCSQLTTPDGIIGSTLSTKIVVRRCASIVAFRLDRQFSMANAPTISGDRGHCSPASARVRGTRTGIAPSLSIVAISRNWRVQLRAHLVSMRCSRRCGQGHALDFQVLARKVGLRIRTTKQEICDGCHRAGPC
jgi:hypothetical protein